MKAPLPPDETLSGACAPAAAAASSRPAPPRVALWLLVLITFSGTLGMHMFVPALPAAAIDLNAGMAALQATISLYIVGLAVGQLIYGPLSDCFGRRPVLLAGLTLYTITSMVAAFAPSAPALIAIRLLQAMGGCAGMVLARAIVRDTATTDDTVRRLALMNLMMTIGPGLAPLLGSLLTTAAGWRSIFVALGMLGVVNFLLVRRLLPETGQPTGTINTSLLLSNYKQLLSSPTFVGFSIGGSCATMAVYAIVVTAPFIVVDELGRSIHEAGLLMGLIMLGISIGNFIASRLAGRVAIEQVLVRANLLSLGTGIVFLSVVLMDALTITITAAFMLCFALGVGMAGPGGIGKAISVDARLTGTASGLYGFTQMSVGALCTALVGLWSSPSLAAGIVVTLVTATSQTSLRLAIRKSRSTAPASPPPG